MKRRVLGILSVVLASQLLSACVVLPVPGYRARAVVVEPGYGYGHGHGYRDPYWRR
jgi:hypothetical protein